MRLTYRLLDTYRKEIFYIVLRHILINYYQELMKLNLERPILNGIVIKKVIFNNLVIFLKLVQRNLKNLLIIIIKLLKL